MTERADTPVAETSVFHTSGLELVSAAQLPERLVSAFEAATDRIVTQSMSAVYCEETALIFDSLQPKIGNIRLVRIVVDAYTQRFDDAHHGVNPFGTHVKNIKETLRRLDDLKRRGAEVVFSNPYGKYQVNSYSGRSHDKGYLADEWVAEGGAVDLKRTGFNNADFMICGESPMRADMRERRTKIIRDHGRLSSAQDEIIELDEHNTFILVTGMPGRSATYERVEEELARSDVNGIRFWSQFRPVGRIAANLLMQQQKLGPENVVVVANRPSQLVKPGWAKEELVRYRQRRSGLVVATLADPDLYLHRKVVEINYESGETLVVIGTDNFHDQGVDFGTVDEAWFSTDPNIVKQVVADSDKLELVF